MVVAFGRLWRVAERSPELWVSSEEFGAGQRMQRGRQPGSGAGFIAVARAWSRAAAGAGGGGGGHAPAWAERAPAGPPPGGGGGPRRPTFTHGRALSAPPSVSPRRTRGSLLLPWFNGEFEHLSMQILEKPLCTVSSLHHILPFLCEFQTKIRSG
jgi:hypothetical protein